MPLTNYQKMCYRWSGRIAENAVSDKLKDALERSHIEIRAGAYLSVVWLNTILAAIVSAIVYILLVVFLSLEIWLIVVLIFIPVMSTLGAYFYYINYPAVKAKSRAKKIDLHLPYALNFIAAMSSAGITPTEIFKSLSKQHIYGELREEALWIYRDVGLLGRDVISAIKANISRTPSEKFKEFLQGAVVTVQSGGALKPYFMSKADQYMRENRISQRQTIESLGVMAEAYVTSAVAGILLLLVVIPIMMIISGSFDAGFLLLIIFILIPIIHIGFAVFLLSASQKV